MLAGNTQQAAGPVSWWSWRPGIMPRTGLTLGGAVTLLALLLAGLGLLTLVSGLLDSFSPPLQLAGIVLSHAQNSSNAAAHLSIQLLHVPPDFPTTLTPLVTHAAFQNLHDAQPILVDFSPRLHFPYAISTTSPSAYYALPGASAAGNPGGACALLLFGLLLLPYPALLARWSWRDLLAELRSSPPSTLLVRVVARRTTAPDGMVKRTPQPGLSRIGSRPWYGLALLPLENNTPQHVMTLSVRQAQYEAVAVDELVRISYSPNLHYLYSMERVQ